MCITWKHAPGILYCYYLGVILHSQSAHSSGSTRFKHQPSSGVTMVVISEHRSGWVTGKDDIITVVFTANTVASVMCHFVTNINRRYLHVCSPTQEGILVILTTPESYLGFLEPQLHVKLLCRFLTCLTVALKAPKIAAAPPQSLFMPGIVLCEEK